MRDGDDRLLPLARKEGLVVKELPDEVLVYDLERHKAHCLNRSAALIWKHCDGRTPVGDMARMLHTEFGSPVNEQLILHALDQLGRSRLLKERYSVPPAEARLSRRDLIRRAGLAAALAVPVVISIVAPTAYAATSCSGRSCVSTPCPSPCVCGGGTCFDPG